MTGTTILGGRRSEMAADVMNNLPPCKPTNFLTCGNIILMHDGGGDRSETVKTLNLIILRRSRPGDTRSFRCRGCWERRRAQVMPPISKNERWEALVASLSFTLFGYVSSFIIFVFFIGDVLMTGRLLFIGALAIFDRSERTAGASTILAYKPAVAVLIPAYNEEMVIERTVRAVLDSDYPNLRAIVIDDGSKDRTVEVVRRSSRARLRRAKSRC